MKVLAAGALWGYADGEPMVVGIVVGLVAAAALGFIGLRAWRAVQRGRKERS